MSVARIARWRKPWVFRSASLRLAAVYGALFAASALALVMFLWWSTAGLLQRQVEAAIHADAQGLSERWQEGGVPALVLTIEERLSENVDDDAIYLLTDALGQRVAGNVARFPPTIQQPEMFYDLQVTRAGMRSLAEVYRADLPGGFRLLVGRDVRTRTELRHLLTNMLVWAALLVVALGLVGAAVMRGLFRRMVADVSATAAAIAASAVFTVKRGRTGTTAARLPSRRSRTAVNTGLRT